MSDPSTVMPIERAEPAIGANRGVQIGSRQVLHLGLGDLFDLRASSCRPLSRCGFGEPLSSLAAFLISTVAPRRLEDEGEATCPRTR